MNSEAIFDWLILGAETERKRETERAHQMVSRKPLIHVYLWCIVDSWHRRRETFPQFIFIAVAKFR